MTAIAIVGAGIAGLTASLALAANGADVALFDAAGVLSEAGAGVQLSSNATRVLRGLGLLDAVAAAAVRPDGIVIRRGRDGVTLAFLPLGTVAERRYGAPFLVTHRADLQAALLEAVRRSPRVTLSLGQRIDAFDVAAGGVAMTLAPISGGPTRRLAADGLIGADGLHSVVRRALMTGNDALLFSGRSAWRSLVPRDAAPAFARRSASNLWLGRKAHLVHYPVRGGALINVVAIVESEDSRSPARDAWAEPGDAALLQRSFDSWCDEARGLLASAPEWRVWPLFERKPLLRWSQGPVMLAGDAAHPMLPFLAQGAAQAIQDGAAIAHAVRGAASITGAGAAYERARRPVAERVQRESRRQGAIYHLAAPASLARDAAFAVLGAERMLARYDWLYRS